MTNSDERDKWMQLAGGAVILVGAGVGVRRFGKGHEADLDAVKTQLASERTKEKRDELTATQQKLDDRSGLELTIGTSSVALGASLAVMALAVGAGAKLRKAAIAIAPSLTFAACYAVYMVGVESLVPSTLLGVALVGWMTLGPDARADREAEAFRKLPMRRELDTGSTGDRLPSYRQNFLLSEKLTATKLLRQVDELPRELERMIPIVGEGRVVSRLQLREGIAYAAFVESDALNLCDYVTVVMALDEKGPRFSARPVPIEDGRKVTTTGLKFREDAAFSDAYLVEVAPGADPRRVRALLADDVRAEILGLPGVCLHVDGAAMAATLYGPIDHVRADELVELADFLFEIYGADGGPSLLEPDGIVGTGVPKKKRKKKAADAGSVDGPEGSSEASTDEAAPSEAGA